MNPSSDVEALMYPEQHQRAPSDVSDVDTFDGYYDEEGFPVHYGEDDDYAAIDRALPFYNTTGDVVDGDLSVLIP